MDKTTKQTLFNLTETERSYLKEVGGGNMNRGLKTLLAEAIKPTEKEQGTKKVIRRITDYEDKIYKYILYEGGIEKQSLEISFEKQNSMLQKYGEDLFYQGAIIQGLIPFLDQESEREEIQSIIDIIENQTIWKKSKSGKKSENVFEQYFYELDSLVNLLMKYIDEPEAGRSSIKANLKKLIELTSTSDKLKVNHKDIEFYQETINILYRNRSSKAQRVDFVNQIEKEIKNLKVFAKEHDLI